MIQVDLTLVGVTDTSSNRVALGISYNVIPLMSASVSTTMIVSPQTNGVGLPTVLIKPVSIPISTGSGVKQTDVIPNLSTDNVQVSGIRLVTTLVRGGVPITYNTSTTLIRCDSDAIFGANRLPGCVNVYWTPTVNFPMASFPNISVNIQQGQDQLNGLGVPGISTLIRTSQAQREINQGIACSTSRTNELIGPRPEGMTCDEYPLASSTDGGRLDGTIKWVPAAENNSQGGTLGGFYSSNRVMEGDEFYVQP